MLDRRPADRDPRAHRRPRPGRPGATPPPFGSSPFPRHSPSTPSARPMRPASAISARTGSRKPYRRLAKSADLSIRWHLARPPADEQGPKGGAGVCRDSVGRLASSSSRSWTRPPRSRACTPELLIQVDLAGEATKFGAPPDEVPRLFEAAAACRAARVVGLMTLPPVPDTPEDARPWFRRLRDLRDEWLASGVPAVDARRAVDGHERGLRGGHPGRAPRWCGWAPRFSGADMIDCETRGTSSTPWL